MPDPEKTVPNAPDEKTSIKASSSVAEGVIRFRRLLIVLAHIAAFAVSLLLAFLLTKNMRLAKEWLVYQYLPMLLIVLPVKLVVFGLLKQYRGWWRYVGISDLMSIAKASLLSTLLIVVLWVGFASIDTLRRGFDRLADVSQGTIMLDLFTTIMLLGGLRMVIRMYNEEFLSESIAGGIKRFLIVGAGDAGEALLREIMRMKVEQYEVVGFVDDDPAKLGMSIHGITVLGNVEQLPEICQKQRIEEIAIAIPSTTPSQLRHVVRICEGAKVRFRTVPSITDIASGKLRVSQIRDVDINDLLGRDVVELDLDLIELNTGQFSRKNLPKIW